MLIRCSLHTNVRADLVKACDTIVQNSWSTASDDKERYNLLLKDARVQRPLNAFIMKCTRERDSAVLPGDACFRDGSSMPGCL
mmetsp:Transcript_132/g.210  ORF Transcript_132/g.210 Transcript_132/m.210 type:complete len:83 (+) Transcript_132:2-250(+)